MYELHDLMREKNRIAMGSFKSGETSPDLSLLREIYQDVVFEEEYQYNPKDDDPTFWKKCCGYIRDLARRV